MFLTLASQSLAKLLENHVPEGWQYVGAGLIHMALLFAVFLELRGRGGVASQ